MKIGKRTQHLGDLINTGAGEQERCHKIEPERAHGRDVRDLGSIVMELITGDYKDDPAMFERWSSSDAMDFAVKSASARSTADVSQV